MARRRNGGKEPVERLRAWTGSGSVTVAIWENESNERKNYSVTVQRSYKKDGEWHNSDFLCSLPSILLLPLANQVKCPSKQVGRRQNVVGESQQEVGFIGEDSEAANQ